MRIGSYHIRVDTGLDPYSLSATSLPEARDKVAPILGTTHGCSRHEVIIYQWAQRAIDGKPYLYEIERYHFGVRVPPDPGRERPTA